MSLKQWLPISISIILLSLLLSLSCNSGVGLNRELYIYLDQNVKTAIEQSNDNLIKYDTEAAKKETYETVIAISKQSHTLNAVDTYAELVFIGGYWVSDGYNMLNPFFYSYTTDAAGNIHANFEDMPTEADIVDMYERITSIKQNEQNLKWAIICETEAQQISKNIENLKTLLFKWEVSYKEWAVNKIGVNLLSIVGNDLGLYMDSPSIGKWQYFSDEKTFQPADKYAENLSSIIFNIQSYKQNKATYNFEFLPYKIPNYNYSWLSYFDYYHLRETVPLEINYSKDSEETQALFKQYPKLEEYWNMLEELGFNVNCTIVDEKYGYSGDYKILLSVNP
jgi:hypothetical protein